MTKARDSTREIATRHHNLEGWVFAHSPLGFWATSLLLFAIPVACYMGLAWLTGFPLLEVAADGTRRADGALVFALLLSTIFTAALSLAGAPARHNLQLRSDLALTLKDGMAAVDDFASAHDGDARRNILAIVVGLIVGLGINIYPIGAIVRTDIGDYVRSPGLWFLIMSPILFILLVRAILAMRQEGPAVRALSRDQLIVDLDHPDRLHVYGRLALRNALSWLIFAAIGMAFLASGASWAGAIPIMGGAILLAGFSFLNAMRAVHDRIRDEKAHALDQVRIHLSELRDEAFAGDRTAMTALAGLTAYEARLEKLREWPVSAPVTTRFALYILIPAAAWIGAALAERLVAFVAG
tara:strand:+ start:215 stop:1276 length:1062 start_codon:yes stop_codon:yes gene_type:complete